MNEEAAPPAGDAELAHLLRALAHPARLDILRILAENGTGTCCCADVSHCLPLAQSTVSQHIKVLLSAGLIARHAAGTRNCYTVRADTLDRLGTAFNRFTGDLAEPGPVAASCLTPAR